MRNMKGLVGDRLVDDGDAPVLAILGKGEGPFMWSVAPEEVNWFRF